MKCFMSNKECEYPSRKKDEGDDHIGFFMISPFGYPYDDLFNKAVKITIESIDKKYKVERADRAMQIGFVMCQRICKKIQESEYVIADLSVTNPNVYYELGLSYGLNKKILILKNKLLPNQYTEIFNGKNALLEYDSLHVLKNRKSIECLIKNALSNENNNALSNKKNSSFKWNKSIYSKKSDPQILHIVNRHSYVEGLHEESIEATVKKVMNEEDKGSEKWSVRTLVVDEKITIDKVFKEMENSKICIIDTTNYEKRPNVYIYFLLGLSHALQRFVIPIINSPLDITVPFDIRGLWQIIFDSIDRLETELIQILRQIYMTYKKEESEFAYKEFWNPFIEQKKLHIMTCARKMAKGQYREDRTHVDKWDFDTVSNLSLFIAKKYKHADVKNLPPIDKKKVSDLCTDANSEIRLNQVVVKSLTNRIEEELREYKDCLIIGSPESSDYAEVVLSQLHLIEPYNQSCEKKPPFQFIKGKADLSDREGDRKSSENMENDFHPRSISSFYKKYNEGDQEKIIWHEESFACSENDEGKIVKGITYGVLTIADNPYIEESIKGKSKIMVLSGFSGIATFGIIECLTNCDDYGDQFDTLYNAFMKIDSKNVNILIKTEYEIKFEEQQSRSTGGDLRKFTNIEYKELKVIE